MAVDFEQMRMAVAHGGNGGGRAIPVTSTAGTRLNTRSAYEPDWREVWPPRLVVDLAFAHGFFVPFGRNRQARSSGRFALMPWDSEWYICQSLVS